MQQALGAEFFRRQCVKVTTLHDRSAMGRAFKFGAKFY
jgi:hypothetical protein